MNLQPAGALPNDSGHDGFLNFFHSVIPNQNYRVIVVFFIIALLVCAVLIVVPVGRLQRQRPNIVLSMVIISLLVLLMAVSVPYRWEWVVGLLPTLLVGYQLFYLWLYHPKETGDQASFVIPPGQTAAAAQQYKIQAQNAIDNNFNLRTLFTRYGLPAVLLGITGIVITDIIVEPQNYFSAQLLTDNWKAATMMMRGIRLGAVGAFVYVLLQLGRRTFRHDVTGAVAMWCWVTLVLGPVLAAAVAFLWRADADQGAGWWGTGVVLFFTGFAPRRVIAAIEHAAAELLKIGPPSVVQPRLIPLTQVRGIGAEIEERLSEEGIIDVNLLATADPIRLMRNTPFDMRQIINWIDEAILIVTLPRSWQALEEEGITGAIDLAWYYDKVIDAQTDQPLPATPALNDLAGKAKLTYDSFVAAIQRLNQDRQVQIIWTLYNYFTEFGGGLEEYSRKPKPDQQQALA